MKACLRCILGVISLLILSVAVFAFVYAAEARPASFSPTTTVPSTSVVISEFRTYGPLGSNDEFIEIYNLTNAPIDIGGWSLWVSTNAGVTSPRITVTVGTLLPAYGHFLAAHGSSNYAGIADQLYFAGITNDGGMAVRDSAGTIIDQVGMSTGSAYREGTFLPPMGTPVNRSYERRPGGSSGSGQDTDNNLNDFFERSPSDPQNLSSPPAPLIDTPTPTATATEEATATPTVSPTVTQTPTETASPSPTTEPRLVGHVTWQGRPSQPHALQQLPITLTLKMGTTKVNYPEETTDASGFFTVSVGSLPVGTYDWRAKGPKYLANGGVVSVGGEPTTSVEIGLMRVGDANNDNIVNIADFNILAATFGKAQGDPDYDDRADFNGDTAVTIADFNLLRGSFGLGGVGPLGPSGDTLKRTRLTPP